MPWGLAIAGGTIILALVAACGEPPSSAEPEIDAVAQQAVSNRNFGIHCTSNYESLWLASRPEAWTISDRFAAEAAKEASQAYYYNLSGKQYYWHTGGDGAAGSLEDVDLFFAFTHGSVSTTAARWAMWDEATWAYSSSMELGDELRGTSVLATYSGMTLAMDANTWTRWDSVFGGGLRMTLGSHGWLYADSAERDVGKVFAQYLNAGYSFKTAWALGFDLMAYNHNDVAVMATGTSSSNCNTRRDNLSWDNFSFTSYPRLTTGTIAAWCGYVWDDI